MVSRAPLSDTSDRMHSRCGTAQPRSTHAAHCKCLRVLSRSSMDISIARHKTVDSRPPIKSPNAYYFVNVENSHTMAICNDPCPCSNFHKAEKDWRFSRAGHTVTVMVTILCALVSIFEFRVRVECHPALRLRVDELLLASAGTLDEGRNE